MIVKGRDLSYTNTIFDTHTLLVNGRSFTLANLDDLLDILQIPKKYIARCMESDLQYVVINNINAWLSNLDQIELELDGEYLCVKPTGYPQIELSNLYDWYELDTGFEYDNAFAWFKETNQNFRPGYQVTHTAPTLRVDAAVCNILGLTWLWPTKLIRTRNEAYLSVAMNFGEAAARAVEIAESKLHNLCEYSETLDAEHFLTSLWDALRLSRKTFNIVYEEIGGGPQDEYTLHQKVLLATDKFDAKAKRSIALALGKRASEGVFK